MRYAIFEMKDWMRRKSENAVMWLALHLPRELRKWVVVMAAVKACGNTKSPAEISYPEMYESA